MFQDNISVTIVNLVVSSCVCSIIGLFGLAANIINMIVFIRQGLNSSINISLFSMAVADFFTILFVLWANVCFNPYIDYSEIPFYFPEVFYATGGWPSGLSYRMTLHLTVYITAERCLCILFPLKIKSMITPKRAVLTVGILGIFNAAALVPEYSSVYLSWRFNEQNNKTMLGVAFRSNISQTFGITYLLHVILVVMGLFSVIALTSVLVMHLRRQTKWRMKNTGNIKQRASYSSRDRKSELLVVLVAISVVISYIPLTCVSLVSVFLPEFSIGGTLSDILIEAWGLIYIFGMTNASSNIIIYYKMNSKFRSTLRKLWSKNQRIVGISS
ncbi:tachykinin peptides receptor 86C [Biomphalaria glabrata]|nr:tachykinin peptides receptor 86C [Biomphalaria glabrata]